MSDHRAKAAESPLAGRASNRAARLQQLRGGKHGLTPEQVAASQRERVLAAMRDLVGAHGYGSVAVAGVLRHAGVSRKTFYELYSGKEECFVAVYKREMSQLLAPALRAFAGEEPWKDRLRTALGVLLGSLADDPLAARICFVEVLVAGPLALERRAQALAALDPLFTVDSGTAHEPDEATARAIAAGSVGHLAEVLHREIAAGRTADLPRLRAQLTDTLGRPFAGGSLDERPATNRPTTAPAPSPAGPSGSRDHSLARPDEPDPAPSADDASERAYLAGYGKIAADVLGRVSTAMAVDEEPAERIRAGVAALLDFCGQRPDRARTLFVEALSAGPAARERRSETTRRLSDLLAQPLRELRPNERIAEISAIALMGGFHELTFDAVDRLAPADLPTVETVVAIAGLD